MKLLDFTENRGIKLDTAVKYIYRHDEFRGHYKGRGSKIEIDDVAEELLSEIYPLQIIQVVKDEETERLLKEATKHIIELQQRMSDQTDQLIELKAEKLALEMKVSEDNSKMEALEQRVNELDRKNLDQEQAIERLKNRSLIQRILNKD